MSLRIQDVLLQKAGENFVGRQHERELLRQSIEKDGPIVNFIHGIGGIGKSSLLNTFAEEVRERGIPVILLDCREIEPTMKGFLRALEQATGQILNSPAEAGQRLSKLGDRVVLALDSYEVFRLMDTWMRQKFIPALSDNIRVILAGREPPVSAWQIVPGWESLFQCIHLEPLNDLEAQVLLGTAGLPDSSTRRINQYLRGHPLALKLAAVAIVERPDLRLSEVASQKIIPHLTQLYLEDVSDRITREALEAVSVVRRVTQSLLRVLLPESAPQDVYERLATLPFVSRGSDGLIIHDTIRQVIADNLNAADPNRYRTYRYLAYRQYRKELQTVNPDDIWRYTADFLYMIEEPVIREAFFPSDMQPFAVDSAHAGDWPIIHTITQKHEGPESVRLTEEMWQKMPGAFRAIRNQDEKPVGYLIVFDPRKLPEDAFLSDPIMRNWWQHLKECPIPDNQRVLFFRRWMGEADGELPSPVQAAAWLDVKGDYIRMRSVLRRVYCTAIDTEVYGPVLVRLGFQIIPEAVVKLDKSSYQTAMLDFGPKLMLGWLDGHVRAALEVEEEILDYETREVIIGGERIALTPLEFGVIAYLYDHEDRVVTRTALLNHVWGYDYEGGSNVVDVRIRGLRKKLGSLAAAIETVSGVGYRYHIH